MTPSTSNEWIAGTMPSRRMTGLKLVEQKFGDSGRDFKAENVFQALFRGSRKGKERAFAEVWLDGQTVRLPSLISYSY